MKRNNLFNTLPAFVGITITPVLFILLFTYTGTSKLLGHSLFVQQLSIAGLSQKLAITNSYLVPLTEILIAILLAIRKFRKAGLWAAFIAMLFFTAYVAVVLSGEHIPCSCGGVLSALSWKGHLYFNIVFLSLAASALYYNKEVSRKPLTE